MISCSRTTKPQLDLHRTRRVLATQVHAKTSKVRVHISFLGDESLLEILNSLGGRLLRYLMVRILVSFPAEVESRVLDVVAKYTALCLNN